LGQALVLAALNKVVFKGSPVFPWPIRAATAANSRFLSENPLLEYKSPYAKSRI
jgi:hypothetical protein